MREEKKTQKKQKQTEKKMEHYTGKDTQRKSRKRHQTELNVNVDVVIEEVINPNTYKARNI